MNFISMNVTSAIAQKKFLWLDNQIKTAVSAEKDLWYHGKMANLLQ